MQKLESPPPLKPSKYGGHILRYFVDQENSFYLGGEMCFARTYRKGPLTTDHSIQYLGMSCPDPECSFDICDRPMRQESHHRIGHAQESGANRMPAS